MYNSILETIGNTPLVKLGNIRETLGLKNNIYAKVELFNPAGSVKDRIAYAMIKDMLDSGKIKKGDTIIEPTSGNTGIGLSMVATALGLNAILVMPDTMSVERRNLIGAYGAKIELTPGANGMKGAIARAKELQESIPGSVIPGQFVNPSNPQAHYKTTGPEIVKDLEGKVDYLVAGVGTGGTLSGAGKYIKEQNLDAKVIAIEPASSNVISGGEPGPHKIQGIGAGFLPDTLDKDIIDEIITIENDDAFSEGKEFAMW